MLFIVNLNPWQTETSGLLGRRMEPMFTSNGEMLNPLMNRVLGAFDSFGFDDFPEELSTAEPEIYGR